MSSFLSLWFYYINKNNSIAWKCQNHTIVKIPLDFYTIPLLSDKTNRGPFHKLFTTINLVVASCFSGILLHLCYNKQMNPFDFSVVNNYDVVYTIFKDFFVAVVYEHVIEYYWHRMMHTKVFYHLFHKYHHYYKSPEVFDDMYIHPIEAFGYYCILYSPPFIFHTHVYAFILYMSLMGLCGILDHSGIKLSVGM